MERREDGWWFTIRGIECGPYVSKQEATDDLQRVRRFVSDHPDFDGSDTSFAPALCPFHRSISMTKTSTKSTKSASKSSAKTVTKASVKAKKEAASDGPDRSMAKVPPTERRVAVVKAMRSLGATKPTTGVPLAEIAEKVGYTNFDVYGVLSGTSGKANSAPNCLVNLKFAGVSEIEGKGRTYYLTSKGQSTKFDEAPFIKVSKASAEK